MATTPITYLHPDTGIMVAVNAETDSSHWYGIRKIVVDSLAGPLEECARLIRAESKEKKEKEEKKKSAALAAGKETETMITLGRVHLGRDLVPRLEAAQSRKSAAELAKTKAAAIRKEKSVSGQAAKLLAARVALEGAKLPSVPNLIALVKACATKRSLHTTLTGSSTSRAVADAEWARIKPLLGDAIIQEAPAQWSLWRELNVPSPTEAAAFATAVTASAAAESGSLGAANEGTVDAALDDDEDAEIDYNATSN
jgi:hypothetical protein